MPIAPIMMTPYYRFGAETPWGGDGLRRLFGKEIPDDRTGESLEVSAIPGKESRDPEGNPLSSLIERYGERLTGRGYAHPFPLLLKLLDARDTLSVQVHPDDAYAMREEGKLGKTEAWYILHTEPGAQLVYGLREGTTREELLSASTQGAAVQPLLRRIDIHPGETYYIPAGTVHAICKGTILYEIQQSSDVTYRFYDWDRVDRHGKKRELHIRKAVDVASLTPPPQPTEEKRLPDGRGALLREKYFSLDHFSAGVYSLPGNQDHFSFLTAVKPCTLSWADGTLALPAGRTALLPADGFDLTLTAGEALLAYPSSGINIER